MAHDGLTAGSAAGQASMTAHLFLLRQPPPNLPMRVSAPQDSRHESDRRYTKPGYWSREFQAHDRKSTYQLYKYGSIQRRGRIPDLPLEPDNSSFLLCRLSTKLAWLDLASEHVWRSLRAR